MWRTSRRIGWLAGGALALALMLSAPIASAKTDPPESAHCRSAVLDHAYRVTNIGARDVGCRTARHVIRRWLQAGGPESSIGGWACDVSHLRPYVTDACTATDGRSVTFVYGSLFG
jgi:hypothetical protein